MVVATIVVVLRDPLGWTTTRSLRKLTGKPLVANPDLALEWEVALYIMYVGINKGLFGSTSSTTSLSRDRVTTEGYIACQHHQW